MASPYRMAAILIFSIIYCFCGACEIDDVAVYKVKVHLPWSEDIKVHTSLIFGQSHNRSYALYRIGELARPTVRNFIQYGVSDYLMEEGSEEPKVYDQFTTTTDEDGTTKTESIVFVDGGHSLVSLIARMMPQPDWFLGVDSLDLCVHFSWLEDVTLDLEPLNAGVSMNNDQEDVQPVSKLAYQRKNFEGQNSYMRNRRHIHSNAKVEFTKIKEYSSKELNNLARKELIASTKQENVENSVSRKFDSYSDNEKKTTKNPFEQLKDLEEEPLGTPRPNVPDNDVIIVTKAPVFKDSAEFDSHLQNMDEVVLAVANGKKLGLGKHLPRHFRSRLHHAVNKRRGKDCVVSKWGNWSTCSDPCSEQSRVRTVVQEKIGDGQDCPTLIQKQPCGRCVRGDGDYVW